MSGTAIRSLAQRAKESCPALTSLSVDTRNEALLAVAAALEARQNELLAVSALDVADAERDQLPMPIISRLRLTPEKCARMAEGLRALCLLPDPLGRVDYAREICEGQRLYRVSCPIGVVGIIFESRPDALVQISSLCLKSGNAVLLKGGREAARTNELLYQIIAEATIAAGLPDGWCALLHSREDVAEMLKLDDCIDLIIPRGSNAFVRYIMENSLIPVLGHAEGLCHVYVDKAADIDLAVKLIVDSKTQSLAVCNATETLLVHQAIAEDFLPKAKAALEAKRVRLLGCERTRRIIACFPATDEDWRTEYLDLILSVRVVDDLAQAIAHINEYGSGHTDCIISQDAAAIETFMTRVDSAGVFSNCSTRFSDGFLYGFGAEVGIATGKLHARGPMGLEGLCTYKYRLYGSGQTLAELNAGQLRLTHREIDKTLPSASDG